MAQKIFITGTDTDVGKTVVSSLLADYLLVQGLHCGYLKLVSCGGTACEDCCEVHIQSGVVVKNGYHFSLPASPHLAAEQDGRLIDVSMLDQSLAGMDSQYEVLLVEGAGGVVVPLTRSLLLGDYIANHGMLALVVARSGLGTINHTLLTLEALKSRGIPVLGIIFNDEQRYSDDDLLVADNVRTLAEFGEVPVLGRLPRFDSWYQAKLLFVKLGAGVVKVLNG